MKQLLGAYDLTEILTFLVLLALAVKGVVTFYDWAKDRLGIFFGKETKKQLEKISIEKRFIEDEQELKKVKAREEELADILNNLTDKIDLLIMSDKDDIKAWITDKHHYYCYDQQWIDDYTMDCIEKRFSHYQAEGGNSFIENMMIDLRNLSRVPPKNKE